MIPTDGERERTESEPGETTLDHDIEPSDDHGFVPLLLRASAGTGKTYRLTARLLRILLQDVPPETILATTFTRKAAGEITNRILVDLAKAADPSDDAGLRNLQQQLELPGLPRNECLRLLDSLLRNIHRLRICTLDSLFSQLARSFAFELNLPPAWRLTDEIEEEWFRERAVDAMITTLDRTEMSAVLGMLSKGEVKRSIARELIDVVNEAYATARGCGEEVWKKLIVNKQPIKADIDSALAAFRSASPKQKRLATALAKIIETLEHGDFETLSEETLISNIALARRTHSELKFYRSAFPAGLDEAFDVLYAAVQSRTLALLSNQNKATGDVLSIYDQHVQQMKFAARTIGFDDVAFQLANQLGGPDQRTLANRMDGAINHILLDEFQDTSPVQWRVLRPLAKRVTDYERDANAPIEEERAERSFFCVGDTKQAIYGWRGGVSEIFDAVSSQLPELHEQSLETSYRSSPVVINFVNEVFQRIDAHPGLGQVGAVDPSSKEYHQAAALKRFAETFPEHRTARNDLAGYVRVETTQSKSASDDDPNFVRAAAVAKQIHREAPEKEIGILTRSNDGVADVMRCFRNDHIEVSQEGGNPLTDSAAVDLVLSALMMSEHPGDGRWEFHCQHSPLAQLQNFGSDWVRDLIADRGIAETVEQLAGAIAPQCSARDTIRLKQLVQLAIGYQSNAAPRVRDFVRMVGQKRIERPQAAKIRVMTVHQSKGLEFDAIILPELEGPFARIDGRCIPMVDQPGDPATAITRYTNAKVWHFLSRDWQLAFGAQVAQATNEAICLLYVAITRARQAVHVIMHPATKPEFQNKHAAALVFHSLASPADPTSPAEPNSPADPTSPVDPTSKHQLLYQRGDPDWFSK